MRRVIVSDEKPYARMSTSSLSPRRNASKYFERAALLAIETRFPSSGQHSAPLTVRSETTRKSTLRRGPRSTHSVQRRSGPNPRNRRQADQTFHRPKSDQKRYIAEVL
jgi:hypothetical protein